MTAAQVEPPAEFLQGFSLFDAGPLNRIARGLGLIGGGQKLPRVGILLALLAWLPLAVLSGMAAILGGASGAATVPFHLSLGTHARFLVAIPLFFAAEVWIGPRLSGFLRQMVASQLVGPEDVPALDRIVAGAARLCDSAAAEAALVLVTVATMTTGLRIEVPGDVSSWRTMGGVLTWAGWWHIAVSLPIFQFLCWRWCWRLIVWMTLLWRVSRLSLRLVPTHPDLSGGLGYLGATHTYFGTLSFAVSAVLSASFAEQVLFAGRPPQAFLKLAAAIVLMNFLAFLAPLLCFTPQMLEAKRRGLREYGVVAAMYTHLFDAKWVRRGEPAAEAVLGNADIQSLADLAESFSVVRDMRLTPFGPAVAFGLMVFALAPVAPLLLFQFSPDELLLQLAKLLLG